MCPIVWRKWSGYLTWVVSGNLKNDLSLWAPLLIGIFWIVVDYLTNCMLIHIHLTRSLNLKYFCMLIVSILISSNYFLFSVCLDLFTVVPEDSPLGFIFLSFSKPEHELLQCAWNVLANCSCVCLDMMLESFRFCLVISFVTRIIISSLKYAHKRA
jgi:hypothetical protein